MYEETLRHSWSPEKRTSYVCGCTPEVSLSPCPQDFDLEQLNTPSSSPENTHKPTVNTGTEAQPGNIQRFITWIVIHIGSFRSLRTTKVSKIYKINVFRFHYIGHWTHLLRNTLLPK